MSTDMGLAPRHRDTPSPLSIRSRLEVEGGEWLEAKMVEPDWASHSNLQPQLFSYAGEWLH